MAFPRLEKTNMRGKVEKAKNCTTGGFPRNFHVEKTLIYSRFRRFHISMRLYKRRWMEMRGDTCGKTNAVKGLTIRTCSCSLVPFPWSRGVSG
jgi:hypothetical protein